MKEWTGAAREEAEAKSYWDEFFAIFGIRRRTVASFEEPVRKLSGNWGFIDLFWPGTLLVEHKSRGTPLVKAEIQAFEYVRALKDAGRDDEIPRYVLVSDFARLGLFDLDTDDYVDIPLGELDKYLQVFAFIPGYKQHTLDDEDPINVKAVEKMGQLHDALEDGGYSGHLLERFLVRILFCLFAEDTGIFERNLFTAFVEGQTRPDGADMGAQLARLFHVLNTPSDARQKNLDETLASLPNVNGDLFAEDLGFADFTRPMRDALVRCCRFDWSRISPAVFGSLFQSVMEPRERRQVGAHYTSERDILKLVRSLFLDDLREEFARAKQNKTALHKLHDKLGSLRFLDPACGCGNFLVVTYRDLRLLELEILKVLYTERQQLLEVGSLCLVDVDAMFGIEINEFPARIAEVAMWLVDHQMNLLVSKEFGQYFVRLPLKKSARIVIGNALRIDWAEVVPQTRCSFVMGNPPFVGKRFATPSQKGDMEYVWNATKGVGMLDYVTAWYLKAAQYTAGTGIRIAFVSTNSITQGEQIGVLWRELFGRFPLKIHFGHRTFAWHSEARGKAHVHVVIIGFAQTDTARKVIYDYDLNAETPAVAIVNNVSPYLIEGSDAVITNRSAPICNVPSVSFGSMPNDGGFLLLTDDERAKLLRDEPKAKEFVRRFLGSEEFIHGIKRWCIWLENASPAMLRSLPLVRSRLEQVRKHRIASTRETTRRLSTTPGVFGEIRQPKSKYLAIPKTSSETRRYIPMAFVQPHVVASTELFTCTEARGYHFGILSSTMHMAWVRQVCGRLESRFRYSARLVYNNFPWPETPTEKQLATVEAKAQNVLTTREEFPDCSLADLYDPLAMPKKLSKAHAELDRAVDACYRSHPFRDDRQRVEFLFQLHEKLTMPLAPSDDRPSRRRPPKGSS